MVGPWEQWLTGAVESQLIGRCDAVITRSSVLFAACAGVVDHPASRDVCACERRYWTTAICCDIDASTNDRYLAAPSKTPVYAASRRSVGCCEFWLSRLRADDAVPRHITYRGTVSLENKTTHLLLLTCRLKMTDKQTIYLFGICQCKINCYESLCSRRWRCVLFKFFDCNFYANATRHCRRRQFVVGLSRCPLRSFVRSSGRILFPRYLMNALSNFDETDREYSLAPTMTWVDSEGQRSR